MDIDKLKALTDSFNDFGIKATDKLRMPGLNVHERPEPIASLKDFVPPDNRTRAERREDLERSLSGIDREGLRELVNIVDDVAGSSVKSPAILKERLSDIKHALMKFEKLHDEFLHLNSQEDRRISYRDKELRLEALHDWKDKFRLFFFRVLASVLFVVMVFAIGYIEHEYDWARLPLAKYMDIKAPAFE